MRADDRVLAWPLAALEEAGGILEDRLGGQKLLLLWYPATQTAAIYAPETDGEEDAQRQTLSLVRENGSARAPFVDRQTGSRWGIEGRAIDGPLKGRTLRWLPGVQCRWFAWASEYPHTELSAGARDTAPAKAAETKPKAIR